MKKRYMMESLKLSFICVEREDNIVQSTKEATHDEDGFTKLTQQNKRDELSHSYLGVIIQKIIRKIM